MTKNQERTFSMYKNVKDCLTANNSIALTLPQYASHYAVFVASLDQIAVVQAQQLQNTTKVQTQSKAQLRRECTSSIERLLIALNAYALITQNATLKQQVSAPLSEYKQSADTVFAAQSNNLYGTGFNYVVQLVDYGINAAFFTNFRDDINDYTAIIATPRQTAISNAATTTALSALFDKAKKELTDLTTLVALKKFSEPAFYSNFVASSKIIDSNSKPYALRVVLTDQNNTPLRAFTFTFTRIADGKIFEYKTNENGTIARNNLKAGLYNAVITKTGYTSNTTTITLQENITYRLNAVANTIDKTFSVI
jgi:hypothetical protein